MEAYFQNMVGYLPKLLVFFCSLGIFLLIIIGHYLFSWLKDISKLPWMEPENQQARQKILKNKRGST